VRKVYIKYSLFQLVLFFLLDAAVLFSFLSCGKIRTGIPVLVVFLILEIFSFFAAYRLVFRQILDLEKAILILRAEDSTDKTGLQSTSIDYLISYIREKLFSDEPDRIYKTEAEFNALQNQINPHFLYNTLETIRSRAMMSGLDDVTEMTEALGMLFRYTISSTGNLASLRDEIEHAERYILIQQYRFPGKITFSKDIENRRFYDVQIPKLTIQPLIENAIYHGIEVKTGAGAISIRVYSTQSRLNIEITDNGTGMTHERLTELRNALADPQITHVSRSRGSGIALINVNQRIQFYFGPEYGLLIRSVEQVGTTVTITLPIMGDTTAAYEK